MISTSYKEDLNWKTYGMFGIEGLYNFGCEAIVRGIEIKIHRQNPNAKIVYYSKRYKEDSKTINDIDVIVREVSKPLSIAKRMLNKLLRIVNIPYRFPDANYKMISNECNTVISIGGDIYTIPASKMGTTVKYNKMVQFGEYMLKRGKDIYIEGASIGPFNIDVEKYYITHLMKDIIFPREYITLKYLESKNIRNIYFCPDPAFLLSSLNFEYDPNGPICINLSPLSFKSLFGTVEPGFEKSKDIISSVVKIIGRQVILVPHVISPINIDDNDLLFLERVYDSLENDVKKYVSVLNSELLSFLEVKKTLKKASLVCGARMHCCINAVSESIPTLFLVYSRKANAMAEYVYGSSDYSVDMTCDANEIVKFIKNTFDKKEECHRFLVDRIPQIISEFDKDDCYSEMGNE